jgi:hypothetical protein
MNAVNIFSPTVLDHPHPTAPAMDTAGSGQGFFLR